MCAPPTNAVLQDTFGPERLSCAVLLIVCTCTPSCKLPHCLCYDRQCSCALPAHQPPVRPPSPGGAFGRRSLALQQQTYWLPGPVLYPCSCNIYLHTRSPLPLVLHTQVHSLVDANGITAAALAERGRLDPLRKKIAVCGLILFGTLISTLGKLGE